MSASVRIRSIAAGGDGVGTLPDGRAVFVPRTAPGDLVEVHELRQARRFSRGRVTRWLETSPDRVTPPCPHYDGDDCGSCQLQHLSAEAQRSARRQLVGDALRRIGHLPAEDPPLEASEAEWSYRTKVTLAARGDRIGYRRLGRPNDVFALAACPIARPELNALWTALRRYRALLPATLEQLVLRVDRVGACHAIVRGTGSSAWTRGRELGHALAKDGIRVILWWQPEGGAPRTVYGAKEAYPVMVFEQVHPEMGDRARRHAVAELGALAGQHAWDLYAGIGETSSLLVEAGASVESVEQDPRAVQIAESAGTSAGVTRLARTVEDAIAALKPAHAAVANPPRAGFGDAVTAALVERGPLRLAYVSCDPATLARDLSRLDAVYRVASLRAFDLFPQTAHVETVARLERR